MGAKTFDAETEQLLNGLAEAARRVRQERYGRSVRVKPGTIDRLIALARMGRPGNLPSVMLHQYADALESERAENARLREELEDEAEEWRSRCSSRDETISDLEIQVDTLCARLEAAERVITASRPCADYMHSQERFDSYYAGGYYNPTRKSLTDALDAYDALVAEQEGRDGQ
jgi:hypothetical protein